MISIKTTTKVEVENDQSYYPIATKIYKSVENRHQKPNFVFFRGFYSRHAIFENTYIPLEKGLIRMLSVKTNDKTHALETAKMTKNDCKVIAKS